MEKRRSCPSPAALEEHAAGAHLGKGHAAVEDHAQGCKRCRLKLEALAAEAAALRCALQSAGDTPQSQCPEPAVLAAYLDKAMTNGHRQDFILHAATCDRCRRLMAAIQQETNDIVSEREPDYLAEEPVALPNKKRTKRTTQARHSPTSKTDTADAETRKKRLSSDFD